jgi:hypothetical protein
MTLRRTSFAVLSMLLLGVPAIGAQQESKEQPKPTPQPAPSPEPTLDELLGLKKPADQKPTETKPTDPAKAELERQLSPTEIAEAFEQAVALMGQTADRLPQDTGIATQRMQEDVIRKLDTLIDQAQKQQSKSKSKSKKPDPNQQQQQQQQQTSQQQQSKTADPKQGANIGLQEGHTNAPPGDVARWGNLPEHLRDALTQGITDRFSSMYKATTEKYYKRLAEEPKPGETTPAPAPSPKP